MITAVSSNFEQFRVGSVHASIGDVIEFKRKGYSLIGNVVDCRETTVMVEIDDISASKLQYENNFTVVNHKNYTVVEYK